MKLSYRKVKNQVGKDLVIRLLTQCLQNEKLIPQEVGLALYITILYNKKKQCRFHGAKVV